MLILFVLNLILLLTITLIIRNYLNCLDAELNRQHERILEIERYLQVAYNGKSNKVPNFPLTYDKF